MRVIVDSDLCEANGVCVSVAPEVFELQAGDTLLVLDPTPAEDLRAKVEDAVDGCPRAAIRIEEDLNRPTSTTTGRPRASVAGS